VEVVEPLGSEILLVVKCCESSFLAMVDAEVEVEIGQTIRLNFNMAKIMSSRPPSLIEDWHLRQLHFIPASSCATKYYP